MPDSFEAYRKQRYRWAYGAMTIMKGHWRELLPFGRNKRLNPAQRYQFLAGWMPWIADGLQLLFVYLAIAWSIGMMWLPDKVEPPLTLYLIVTLGMFFFKVGKSMWLYASKVPCSFLDNLGAALAGLSLSYAVSKAVWRGLFTSNLPFHRTPKMENQPAVIRGLVSAREETAIFLMLVLSGVGVIWQRGTDRADLHLVVRADAGAGAAVLRGAGHVDDQRAADLQVAARHGADAGSALDRSARGHGQGRRMTTGR